MRKYKILVAAIIAFVFSYNLNGQGNDSLVFTVTTLPNGVAYSPKHVLAIWITDAADQFVRTQKVMAAQRKQYLYQWIAYSAYNQVDAITGSTLNSHQTHIFSWNCQDLDGNEVPDGIYTIYVEYTSRNGSGPMTSYSFTKGSDTLHINPPDETYFQNVSIDFFPYIEPPTNVVELQNEEINMNTFPNPVSNEFSVSVNIKQSGNYDLRLVSLDGYSIDLLKERSLIKGHNTFSFNLSMYKKIRNGVYFICLYSENELVSFEKILVL